MTSRRMASLLALTCLLSGLAFPPAAMSAETSPSWTWPAPGSATASLDRLTRSWKVGPPIFDAMFDPAGKRLVLGCGDGTVQIRDAGSGEVLEQWSQGSPVSSVQFTPDGSRVLTTSDDRQAVLREARDGSMVRVWRHGSPVNGAAIAPDGRTFVTASADRRMTRFNLATGKKELEWEVEGTIFDVAFGPDGRKLLTGSRERNVVWRDLETDRVLLEGEHEDAVWSVAVSGDGLRLVSGAADRTVVLRQAKTNEVLARWTLPSAVLAVAISPDGRRVVGGCHGGQILAFEAAGEAPVATWTAAGPVRSVAFSPDGGALLVGGEDGALTVRRLPFLPEAFRSRLEQRLAAELARLKMRPAWIEQDRARIDRERPEPPSLVYEDGRDDPETYTRRVQEARDSYDAAVVAHAGKLKAHLERVAAWQQSVPERVPFERAAELAGAVLEEAYGSPLLTDIREAGGHVTGRVWPSEFTGLGVPARVGLVGPTARRAVGKQVPVRFTFAFDERLRPVWQRGEAQVDGQAVLVDEGLMP